MVTRLKAYRLLGLTPDATPAEVRSAFRRKVMEQHPDTAVEGAGGSTVQELVDAYHLLLGSVDADRDGVTGLDRGSTSGYRIEVDHRPPPDQPRASRPCQGCGGAGIRRRFSTCTGCGGAGHMTILDARRVRRSRCGSCGGRGGMRTVEVCPVCGGAGIERRGTQRRWI